LATGGTRRRWGLPRGGSKRGLPLAETNYRAKRGGSSKASRNHTALTDRQRKGPNQMFGGETWHLYGGKKVSVKKGEFIDAQLLATA